jgi:hypothetical protein
MLHFLSLISNIQHFQGNLKVKIIHLSEIT